MPLRFAHAGDFHLDEDRYFADTAHCLEWFITDGIQTSVYLFVINGDLTTYQANLQHAAWLGPRLCFGMKPCWAASLSSIWLEHSYQIPYVLSWFIRSG